MASILLLLQTMTHVTSDDRRPLGYHLYYTIIPVVVMSMIYKEVLKPRLYCEVLPWMFSMTEKLSLLNRKEDFIINSRQLGS